MRVLVMAPFARGRQHGGSQRATAVAERLEERGAEIVWQEFPGARTSTLEKLRTDLLLRPALLGTYPVGEPPAAGPFDAVIASHSYLAFHLPEFPRPTVRVVDFHNLEHRTLANAAAAVESPVRSLHPWLQVALMRRYERRVIAAADVAAFVSAEELAWAERRRPASRLLRVPSVLPRVIETQARAVADGRVAPERELVYIGSLDFPPNVRSLIAFLREAWPAIRTAVPGVRLTIAGGCSDADRSALGAFPDVVAHGFVEDVVPLLSRAAAVVLPVAGWGGTSLRALYYAVAGVPVIGPPEAFRGLPWSSRAVARTPQEWGQLAERAVSAPGAAGAELAAIRRAALALQADPGPWDRLAAALRESPGDRRVG